MLFKNVAYLPALTSKCNANVILLYNFINHKVADLIYQTILGLLICDKIKRFDHCLC